LEEEKMCLSTVYKNEKTPENVVLGNVMMITCDNGKVTLTDIMGREAVVEGEILSADLTGGTVVVKTKAS
jgi:predicted RNA-binding protein